MLVPLALGLLLPTAWAEAPDPGPELSPQQTDTTTAGPPPEPVTPVPPPCATAASAATEPDPAAVAALEAYAFSADWGDKERRGLRTDAVVILKGDTVVYERYANGYTPDSVHLGWSMSKTATALLAGMAVQDGRLSLDTSVCTHIDGLPEASCAVNLGHLLDFASGFDWLETYEGQSPTRSSVLAMLYGEGRDGMGAFVAGHPVRDAPGSVYMYSSGDTNVVATMLDDVFRPLHGADWPETLLLDRAGMQGATWERDGAGVPVGSSYLWATPRDFARLGAVLRDGGCAKGAPLVAPEWVSWMGDVSEPIQRAAYDRWSDNVQGRQLWLNQPLPAHGLQTRPWPQVPDDAVAMLGHWGQSVTAIPSLDLVIVRMADDRGTRMSKDRFLAHAIAVTGDGPIPTEAQDPPAGPVGDPTPLSGRVYAAPLLQLGSAFAAKGACSCIHVAGRDEDWCRDWLRVSPDVARWRLRKDGSVTARALGMASSTARYQGPGRGCVLVD